MGYPVKDNENLVGIVTFHDVSKVPEDLRSSFVRDIMTKELIVSSPTEEVIDALKKLSKNDIGRLPVVEDGKLVGIVSKTDVMRSLEVLNLKLS